jgi:tetratricopeptide (TPR) repeat protein
VVICSSLLVVPTEHMAGSVTRRPVLFSRPSGAYIASLVSQHALHSGDYANAVEYARQTIGIDLQFWVGYMQLGQALERTGQIDQALEALATAEHLSGGNSKPVSLKGYILAKAGRTSEARAVLDGLVARSRDRYVPMYAVALLYAGLGDSDAMFKALDAARDAGDVHVVFLPVDPKWAPYRGDSRFKTILERCAFLHRRN